MNDGAAVGLGAISGIRTRLITLPLPRPWGPDVTSHRVVEVTVETTSGQSGTGFSWTPQIGAHAVQSLLEHDIRDFAVARPADAESLWPALWAHLHEAGSGGITTIAMAGLDLALWDAAGHALELPLPRILAGESGGDAPRAGAGVYGSGVNRHYGLDELVAQAERWRDTGYRLVKLKVGGRELAEDVRRVAAVRAVLGPDIALAIDANQLWSLEEAERAVGELGRFELSWIEEPLRADDLAGHTALRGRIGVPIALGENLHTVYRFREAIEGGACDLVQPNPVRVGGITPFRAIDRLAEAAGVPLHPHLLPEISGQLALASARPMLVEHVEDAALDELGALAEPSPVVLDGPVLRSAERAGLGIVFR